MSSCPDPLGVGKGKSRRTCINCGLNKSAIAFNAGKAICRRCHKTFGNLVIPDVVPAATPKHPALRPNSRVCSGCHLPHGPGAYRKDSKVCRRCESAGRAASLAEADAEAAKATALERQFAQPHYRKLTPGEIMADLPDSCLVLFGTASAGLVAAVTAAVESVSPNAMVDAPAATALHASLVVKSLV